MAHPNPTDWWCVAPLGCFVSADAVDCPFAPFLRGALFGPALLKRPRWYSYGALQQSRVPDCAADFPCSVTQVVAPDYRNPQHLPPGAVVDSGETGCQIAEELVRAGPRFIWRAGAVGGRHAAIGAETSPTGSGRWAG